jgi:hypothetical protein
MKNTDFHQQYENEQCADRACGIYHGEYWAKRAIASVLEETGIQLHFEHVADWQCRIFRKFGNI